MKVIILIARYLGLAVAAIVSQALVAAPPPPAPPNTHYTAEDLSILLNEGRIGRYLDKFDSNIKLYVDGSLVAHTRSELEVIVEKWISSKLMFEQIVAAEGGGEYLVFERVSKIPASFSNPQVSDCCWWYRTVRYRFTAESKISEMSILESSRAYKLVKP